MKHSPKTVLPLTILVTAAALSAGARQASAAFVATVTQVGNDVDIVGSGTFLTNLLSAGDKNLFTPDFVSPLNSFMYVGPSAAVDNYFPVAGPSNFGPGNSDVLELPTSASGDAVAVFGNNNISVPAGYVSGTPLNDSDTFSNTTIAALGMTPGIYVYTLGAGPTVDTFTLNIINPTAVPEPATAGVLGIAALSLLRRRRQR